MKVVQVLVEMLVGRQHKFLSYICGNDFDASRSKLNGVNSFIGALKNANIYFID